MVLLGTIFLLWIMWWPKRFEKWSIVRSARNICVPIVLRLHHCTVLLSLSNSFRRISNVFKKFQAAQTITSLNVTQQYAGKPYAHVCGRRSIENAELVSVRTEARAGDWPWHVAILLKDENNVVKYQCGGNVVSKTAIITGKKTTLL